MKDQAKEPIAVRIMNFWNSLSPEFRYSIFYILAGLLTCIQQVLMGTDLKTAIATFIGTLLTLINGMQAINKIAKEKVEIANQNEPVFGVNLDSPIPDSQEVTPIN